MCQAHKSNLNSYGLNGSIMLHDSKIFTNKYSSFSSVIAMNDMDHSHF